MEIETLKISITKQILNLSDALLLEKIKDLLNDENVIGYEPNGTPISKNDFVNEINYIENEIEKGSLKGFSTNEVRNFILGK